VGRSTFDIYGRHVKLFSRTANQGKYQRWRKSISTSLWRAIYMQIMAEEGNYQPAAENEEVSMERKKTLKEGDEKKKNKKKKKNQ